MAGYEDTKQKIISTLMGRPNGTEIQPENHQDYALNMLDYIRSLELIATSTLIGVAEEITAPVQPNNSRVCYIAGVAQNQTAVFLNFIGQDGQPISVTTKDEEGVFVILMWNTQYWSAQKFSTNIISQIEQATLYYGYNIRKTYPNVAAMNSDIDNPIGTDGKYLKIGDVVTVSNTTTSSENGFYSYEGSEEGWKYQSSFNFQLTQNTGSDPNSAISQNAATSAFALQRMYRTPILNWDISKSNANAVAISDFILDLRITGDIFGTADNPRYWAPVGIYGGDDRNNFLIQLYEVDSAGVYLSPFNIIDIDFPKKREFSYFFNRQITVSKTGELVTVSIAVDWNLWTTNNDAMTYLRLSDEVSKDHFGVLSLLEKQEITTDDVVPVVIKNTDGSKVSAWNAVGQLDLVINGTGFSFTYTYTSRDVGVYSPTFTPNPNYPCKVDIDVDSISGNPASIARYYLCGGDESSGLKILNWTNLEVGKNTFEFDPAHYAVYNGQTSFYIIISLSTYVGGISVNSFTVNQYPMGFEGIGDTLTEVIVNIQKNNNYLDTRVTAIEKSDRQVVLTSPNGIKYSLKVSDDGTIATIPVIPQTALYIGNSLLLGNGTFGMNATNNTKDYYSLIKEEILAVGSGNYEDQKLQGAPYVACTTSAEEDQWLQTNLQPKLDELTYDLVLIQIGDNVDTQVKRDLLINGGAKKLIEYILNHNGCKTRIVWAYGWYVYNDLKAAIQAACIESGALFVDFSDISIPENQSKIGTVITRTEIGNYSIHYDTLRDDSSGIDITFTVDGKQYSSHIVAETYSFDNTTKILTWSGYQSITTLAGVASHPSDEGFQKIANRILYKMGIMDKK